MKKLFISLVAIAAAVFATSCTNDLLDEGVKGGNRVTFNISTPELATRAFGDGATATDLYYAVYEGTTLLNDISVTPGETPVRLQGGKTSIMLDLASGIEYNLIFWAAAPDAIDKLYNVDFATKSMSLINPDKFVSQNEKLDAFYAYVDEVKAGKDEDVELYRPFAQLNISVSEADILAAQKANLTVAETKVVVKKAYKTLNLVDGTVADEVAYTFDFAALPTGDNAADFPKADYTRYAMNYLLVDDTKKLVEVEFAYNRAAGADAVNTRTFGNVPVQRNYRTNIYGDLLTKSTGFEVEIKEAFLGDNLEKWNGTALEEPAIDANGRVLVSTAAQLAYVAAAVNGEDLSGATTRAAAIDYSKATILLTNDIDLGGKEWTPIGVGGKRFSGTFDGDGFTIRGLKITKRTGAGQSALFGNTSLTVAFRNLTIEGASIECPDFAEDFYGAALIGTMYGNVTIENVKVVDSYISGNNKVGALVAHDGVCSSLTINNCHVSGVTFEALNEADGGLVGGLVGFFQGVPKGTQAAPYGEHHISNSSVKNCEFNVVNSTNTGKRSNSEFIGGINSKAGQELYIDNCEVADNQWNEKFYVDEVEVTEGTFTSPYGELVGGERNDDPKGKVFINGYEIVAPGVSKVSENEYAIVSDEGMAWLADEVTAGETFEGKTVTLTTDLDLYEVDANGNRISNAPIGKADAHEKKPFKGTFDGQGHTIANLYQSGWAFDYNWDTIVGYLGLFAMVEDAVVKDVVLDGFIIEIEGGSLGAVAGYAKGTTKFENITIKNSKLGSYNNRLGGVVGWTAGGAYTFENIDIASDVVLGGLWGSFDTSVGGVMGQLNTGASAVLKNVNVACRLDVYNDVTASYDYYNYRMCGMLIGQMTKTTVIDGVTYPDVAAYDLTCENVTVTYGDWMNYHYCRAAGARGVRVEPGFTYGGIAADRDHSLDTVHCYECIPFDQLFGGTQFGCKGVKAWEGVTVNYPASYVQE